MKITSLQNPKVKEIAHLKNRSYRDKTQTFLIEGYREITRAVHHGQPLHLLLVCEDFFLGENEPDLIETITQRGTKVLFCSKSVFEKLSYRDRPDGLLAIAPQIHRKLPEALNNNCLLMMAESIEKPGNLGTILRSSDAAGSDGLILCDRCTDLHNPNVVRASVGTLFSVPVFEATSNETWGWFKENQIQVVAATPSAEKIYTEVDLTGPIAICVGCEQLGLSEKWLERADISVRIPMLGAADSLNVAMAATLLLFEARRQRGSHLPR